MENGRTAGHLAFFFFMQEPPRRYWINVCSCSECVNYRITVHTFLPHLDSERSIIIDVLLLLSTPLQGLISQRSCSWSHQGGQWSPGSKESLSVSIIPIAQGRVDGSFLDVHLWLHGICSVVFLLLLHLEVFPPVPDLKVQRFFEAHPWPSFSSLSTLSVGLSSLHLSPC